MPKICFGMFVKNEARFISGALERIGSFDDAFVIDYGSTDNTRDIVKSKGIDLVFTEWKDHGVARMKMVEIARARNADWLFMLDGDEAWHGSLDRQHLDAWTNDRVNSVSFPRVNLTSATTYKKSWWPDVQHRGLRLDQDIRFAGGPIHAVPTIGGQCVFERRDNLLVQSTSIYHYGLMKPTAEIDLRFLNYDRIHAGLAPLDKLPEGFKAGSMLDLSDSQPIL